MERAPGRYGGRGCLGCPKLTVKLGYIVSLGTETFIIRNPIWVTIFQWNTTIRTKKYVWWSDVLASVISEIYCINFQMIHSCSLHSFLLSIFQDCVHKGKNSSLIPPIEFRPCPYKDIKKIHLQFLKTPVRSIQVEHHCGILQYFTENTNPPKYMVIYKILYGNI